MNDNNNTIVEIVYFFKKIKGKERIRPKVDKKEKLINKPLANIMAYFGKKGDIAFSVS